MRTMFLLHLLGAAAALRRSSDPVSDRQALSAALCSDIELSKKACTALKSSPAPQHNDRRISAQDLADYFVADQVVIDDFMAAIGNPATCEALCVGSLMYASHSLDLSLPTDRGVVCSDWTDGLCSRWEVVSSSSMAAVATQIQLSDDMEDAVHKKGELASASQAIAEEHQSPSSFSRSDTLMYTTPELVVRVANLFDVWPSKRPKSHKKLRHRGSARRKAAVFGPGVKQEHKDAFANIVFESYAWANAALAKMSANPLMTKAWFGVDDTDGRREVRRVLAGMAKTLDDMVLKRGSDDVCLYAGEPSGTKAYVVTAMKGTREPTEFGPRYVIYVCDYYWDPELMSRPDSKYGTLVHESAHHQGPTDARFMGGISYTPIPCLRMGRKSPRHALNNADSFMQFAFYMNRCDGRKPVYHNAPCQVQARSGGHGELAIKYHCNVAGSSGGIIIEDANGYQIDGGFLNLGAFAAFDPSVWRSVQAPWPVGSIVTFLHEADCAFYEASFEWTGEAVDLVTKVSIPLLEPISSVSHHQVVQDMPETASVPGGINSMHSRHVITSSTPMHPCAQHCGSRVGCYTPFLVDSLYPGQVDKCLTQADYVVDESKCHNEWRGVWCPVRRV